MVWTMALAVRQGSAAGGQAPACYLLACYVNPCVGPAHVCLQVKDRQKDTLAKLQAFTQKLRTGTQKQQQQQDKAAAAAAKAAQEAAAEQQRQQEERDKQQAADAAAAASKEAANGSGDKAASTDEAYDGKV